MSPPTDPIRPGPSRNPTLGPEIEVTVDFVRREVTVVQTGKVLASAKADPGEDSLELRFQPYCPRTGDKPPDVPRT